MIRRSSDRAPREGGRGAAVCFDAERSSARQGHNRRDIPPLREAPIPRQADGAAGVGTPPHPSVFFAIQFLDDDERKNDVVSSKRKSAP